MRRFFVLFMVVLLPLRVWAGGAMSVTMVLEQATRTEAREAMPADCPMMKGHGAAQSQHSDSDRSAPASHGASCEACDLCLPFTQAQTIELRMRSALPNVKPLSIDSDPPSAALALRFKPPIS